MSVQGAGRVLGGRYRLLHEIARGGMAAVWEAADALLDRHVAIKVLHPQYADDPEFLERFRREARAAASLSHPNIVAVYDVGEDSDTRTPFLVMELVRGENLKDRIRRAAPLPDHEIRRIGAEVASTLEVAHRRGIVHRDVKPQNILIAEDGRPKLTDFGIAQAFASSGLTRTGAVMGSVHYLAPELVRGRPATPLSDVYSLGAVVYEMATGRVPFSAETDLAIALAHVEERPPAPRTFNARLAPDLERSILRALAKAPEERFSSAAEFAAALRGEPVPAAAPTMTMPVAVPPAGATQRIPIAPAGRPRRAYAAAAAPAPVPRRTARPRAPQGSGVLGLLLAMAAVLAAVGAGFFGLATLSREGVATPEPTARPPTTAPTARPTAAPKPAVVVSPTPTEVPTEAPTATAAPSPSPSPSPPAPSPSPVPPTPTVVLPTPTPRSVAVPQLRGKTIDDARAALQVAGLTMTVRGANANVDRDVVFDQTPAAGSALPPGGTVTILVGTGMTVVPDVTGRSQNQALRLLQDNSFVAVVRQQRDPRVAAGDAIGTIPAAGTAAPRGAQVQLIISTGRG